MSSSLFEHQQPTAISADHRNPPTFFFRWLRRSKLSGEDSLWKMYKQTAPQIGSNAIDGLSDGEAVKQLDPRFREAVNKYLTKLNSHPKSTGDNEIGSKSVQSFYPKCKSLICCVCVSCCLPFAGDLRKRLKMRLSLHRHKTWSSRIRNLKSESNFWGSNQKWK